MNDHGCLVVSRFGRRDEEGLDGVDGFRESRGGDGGGSGRRRIEDFREGLSGEPSGTEIGEFEFGREEVRIWEVGC